MLLFHCAHVFSPSHPLTSAFLLQVAVLNLVFIILKMLFPFYIFLTSMLLSFVFELCKNGSLKKKKKDHFLFISSRLHTHTHTHTHIMLLRFIHIIPSKYILISLQLNISSCEHFICFCQRTSGLFPGFFQLHAFMHIFDVCI